MSEAKNDAKSIMDKLFRYQDGVLFRKKVRSNYVAVGDAVGWKNGNGYLVTSLMNKKYIVHRLIWEMFKGSVPEGKEIDHIDGDRQNNKIENLRIVTRQENMRNSKIRKDNSSGGVGVSFSQRDKKWYASIRVNGKTINLGLYKQKVDAILARKTAEKMYGFHKNHGRTK
tara:strand:- start:341 stop:850 length:510 start_codon:yes stop_codon:yes gene_type:complete